MTYYHYGGANSNDLLSTILANSTHEELSAGKLLNLTYVPPFDEAAAVRIDATGISYNGTAIGEKYIILRTNLKKNARGITLAVTETDNWIDIVTLALKQKIRIVSLTHTGLDEQWFQWNDEGHQHDAHGAILRYVNETNKLMVERGVTHIVVDTTKYNGSEAFEFNAIQEQIIETDFWRHYKRLQALTGALAYGLQSVMKFDFDSTLTYTTIIMVLGFSALEKVDFIKDIQVAWTFPHASATHAFLMWISITVPTFSVLFYFVYIG